LVRQLFETMVIQDSTQDILQEEERLVAVRRHASQTSASDPVLAHLARLMTTHFSVPYASISLVERDDVIIRASAGLPEMKRVSRNLTLCALSVSSSEPVFFADITKDAILCNHPMAAAPLSLKFYASVPLFTRDGFAIGAVCIGHRKAREFNAAEMESLQQFAAVVIHQIEMKSEVTKRARQNEEKEFQLKQAFKLASMGTWEYFIESKKAVWSDELYDLYGFDKQNMPFDEVTAYLSLIHPDDRPAVQRDFADLTNLPTISKERIVRPDGRVIYVCQTRRKIYDDEGRLVKVVGISQDMTERAAYLQKIRDSEEQFKALVQNSSDMIAVLEADGTIRYISPTSLRLSGYSPEELTGRNVFEFMHEEDMAKLVTELASVAENTNTGDPTLHRFRTKQGEWIWLESKGMNMMNNNTIGGIIINARDVTERKRLEERLAAEQKKHQQEMTSAVIRAQETERSQLGRELHDNINQVLTTVKLYTEMIYDGIGDQKELIRKAGHHLQSCIDEIRSISKRLSAPTLGAISLEDSIKELVESINLTNRIEIIYNGTDISGLEIPQDIHLAIYRIIQEQLNNVLKYASASLVFITLKRNDNRVTLHITDNGKGFDLMARRTGIGITNMRTRAENLSGSFFINSAPEKGCQLQVSFPLQEV
jgi:PAS domain S-box-containing protein